MSIEKITSIPDAVEEGVKDILSASDLIADELTIDQYDKYLDLLIKDLQNRKNAIQTDLKKKMQDFK